MKKILLLTLVCFVTLSGYCLAKAHGTNACYGADVIPHGKWWTVPDVVKDLNLTAEEQKQLDDLYVESRRNMVDLQTNLKKERIEMEQLFNAETFNEAECMDRFKRLQNARNHKSVERFSFIVNVRKLLGKDRFWRLKGKVYKSCAKRFKECGKMRRAY